MCAHIGQNRHIYPPSIFRLHFRLVPPPPIPQVHRGGCYREKFFLILFFLILARYLVNGFLRLNNFFIFFLNPLSTRSNYTSIFIFFLIFARNLSEVGIENILNFILVILDYKIPRIFFSC